MYSKVIILSHSVKLRSSAVIEKFCLMLAKMHTHYTAIDKNNDFYNSKVANLDLCIINWFG